MSGEAAYRPAPGYEDKWHIIGPGKNPVWIGRKGDVPKLFTDRFWQAYREWQMFHLGLKVPDDETWIQEAVATLEGQYRARWSVEQRIVRELQELKQIMVARARRR
jgi:hypothetical protein